MNRMIASLVLAALGLALPGCTDKSTVKQETKTTTPSGTTKTTVTKEVEKTGSNPPAN